MGAGVLHSRAGADRASRNETPRPLSEQRETKRPAPFERATPVPPRSPRSVSRAGSTPLLCATSEESPCDTRHAAIPPHQPQRSRRQPTKIRRSTVGLPLRPTGFGAPHAATTESRNPAARPHVPTTRRRKGRRAAHEGAASVTVRRKPCDQRENYAAGRGTQRHSSDTRQTPGPRHTSPGTITHRPRNHDTQTPQPRHTSSGTTAHNSVPRCAIGPERAVTL